MELAGGSEGGSDAGAAGFQRAATRPAWAGTQNPDCRNTKSSVAPRQTELSCFQSSVGRGSGQGNLQRWWLRKFGAGDRERFGSNRTSQSGRFYFRLRSSNCASACGSKVRRFAPGLTARLKPCPDTTTMPRLLPALWRRWKNSSVCRAAQRLRPDLGSVSSA